MEKFVQTMMMMMMLLKQKKKKKYHLLSNKRRHTEQSYVCGEWWRVSKKCQRTRILHTKKITETKRTNWHIKKTKEWVVISELSRVRIKAISNQTEIWNEKSGDEVCCDEQVIRFKSAYINFVHVLHTYSALPTFISVVYFASLKM